MKDQILRLCKSHDDKLPFTWENFGVLTNAHLKLRQRINKRYRHKKHLEPYP